jgi:hypothetical protein
MADDEAKANLDALADDLTAQGLAEDLDFYVVGRAPMAMPSSEHIGISHRSSTYRVWYKDMADKKPLAESEDFETARDVFVAEAVRLAGGRGRGPAAKRVDR